MVPTGIWNVLALLTVGYMIWVENGIAEGVVVKGVPFFQPWCDFGPFSCSKFISHEKYNILGMILGKDSPYAFSNGVLSLVLLLKCVLLDSLALLSLHLMASFGTMVFLVFVVLSIKVWCIVSLVTLWFVVNMFLASYAYFTQNVMVEVKRRNSRIDY
eukprot:TRINITY_DN6985_c0_g1_i1.p1 TRINITY_DN6985_c0_g1~~TRINITY_DN6985_c0_g1_i1.p1  ORF type:complete len:158 (-),score=31.07 TRINITY_DN6985_c0_g1_i1:91-564(-)